MSDSVVQEIKSLLSETKRIAITTHQKPDGDAIGSSLAWYHYLTGLGHQVQIVAPTDYPDYLKWIPGTDKVMIGPNDPDMAQWAFEGADLIFCLDFNALHRINEFEKVVAAADVKTIMIDHHLDPEDFADLMYCDSKASSTAEMIYRLIVAMGERDRINLPIAEALYTGLMTDTGSFRYTTTTPAVHKMAAHLIEVGMDPNKIHEAVYSNSSVDRLRFVGHCLLNCLKVLPEYQTAYILLEKQVFKDFNVKTGYTEGLVNYALGIKGVKLGVLISVQNDLVKLSFRSRDDVSAKAFAEQFNGGGHLYAAGGRSRESLEAVEAKFLELLKTQNMSLNGESV